MLIFKLRTGLNISSIIQKKHQQKFEIILRVVVSLSENNWLNEIQKPPPVLTQTSITEG